jgi:hypothetical protein
MVTKVTSKTNFFSRTTGWIGTILGRNVPDKVLINCCCVLTSISQIVFSKYLVTFLLQSPSSSEVSEK